MTLITNNAEGQSPGTAVAASQSGSGTAFGAVSYNGSATAVYDNSQKMHGAQSYYVTTTAGSDLVSMSWSGVDNASASVRFYLKVLGRPSGPFRVFECRAGAGLAGGVNVHSDGRLLLINAGGSNIGSISTYGIASGVWYRVEMTMTVATSTTGSATAAYYIGDSTTSSESPLTVTNADFGTSNITSFRIGKVTNSSASTLFYLDDIAFDDGNTSLLGGFSPTAPTPWLGV